MSASKSNPHGLTVGQTLHYVTHSYGKAKEYTATVTSVGRKWAEIECRPHRNLRIDIETLRADGRGYSSPGRCYLSEEIYLAQVASNSAWAELRRAIDMMSRPDGVTAEDIRQATKLLGLAGGA